MPQTQQQFVTANLLENPVYTSGKPAKDRVAGIAGANFIKLSIKAGDELPTHHVNKAAFAVLLQGKAKFSIYDQTYSATPGMFLEIPKDAAHRVFAEADSIFLVGLIGGTETPEV